LECTLELDPDPLPRSDRAVLLSVLSSIVGFEKVLCWVIRKIIGEYRFSLEGSGTEENFLGWKKVESPYSVFVGFLLGFHSIGTIGCFVKFEFSL
jgi:hypothetical protein